MSRLFGETEERIFQIREEIQKQTGLKSEYMIWYMLFNEHTNISDGTIIPEKIRDDFLETRLETDKRSEVSIEEYTKLINLAYDFTIKAFERKNLIDYVITPLGDMLPRLKGYNYMTDPKFFSDYKKKDNIE